MGPLKPGGLAKVEEEHSGKGKNQRRPQGREGLSTPEEWERKLTQ